MEHDPTADRRCPTRADGREVLIAHAIDRGTCQQRQRQHYHKCFACAHRNAANGAALNGAAAPPPAQALAKAPSRSDREERGAGEALEVARELASPSPEPVRAAG